jgi:hypothetical protein
MISGVTLGCRRHNTAKLDAARALATVSPNTNHDRDELRIVSSSPSIASLK